MSKQWYHYELTWQNARNSGLDTTEHIFSSWRRLAEYIASSERNDDLWQCINIRKLDKAS